MTSLRLLSAALLVSVTLISCGAFEHYDSRRPTVSQQDAYDVSWGLPPRKSRGNPKLRYQYKASANDYMVPSSGGAAAAPAPSVPAPALSPAPSSAPASSPAIPSTLR
ncbi:MAG: hypothetical protein U1F71_02575 [Verrucomicrobiaceae bacterium]